MRKVLAGYFFALVLAFAVVASASGEYGGPEVDPSITDGSAATALAQARSVWKENRVGSYRLMVSRSCFCAPPRSVTVKVRRGKVVKVLKDGTGKWYGPRTVRGAFGVVGSAIEQKVATLDVTYDAERGFPSMISVDQIAMAVDDEFSYTVKLKPIP